MTGFLNKLFFIRRRPEPSVDFEHLLQLVYSQIIKSSDLVIDVGAHSGRHTKPMASLVGSAGRVLAFEPNPQSRACLEANVSDEIKAGVVEVFPYAVSNASGESRFVIANERPEESGLKRRKFNGPTSISEIKVEVRTLDSLLTALAGKARFVKIDIEGAEYDALRGANELLKQHRPIVAFEFGENSYRAYNVNPDRVYELFENLGYRIYSILGESLDKAKFVNASRVQNYWDYVACPQEKTDLVEEAFSLARN